MPAKTKTETLSTPEAAQRLGVNRRTIVRMATQGRLVVVRPADMTLSLPMLVTAESVELVAATPTRKGPSSTLVGRAARTVYFWPTDSFHGKWHAALASHPLEALCGQSGRIDADFASHRLGKGAALASAHPILCRRCIGMAAVKGSRPGTLAEC